MIGFERADDIAYGQLKEYSKELRKNMTEAESLLWNYLKGSQLGYKFRRQHIIGAYITDFACLKQRLIIELDGTHHCHGEQEISDEQRTNELQRLGFRVIRFTNKEVFSDLNDVIKRIKAQFDYSIPQSQRAMNTIDSAKDKQNGTPLPTEGWGEAVRLDAWAVDAGCSGNPGAMEYQGVDLTTGEHLFHFGPVLGTNNIGEFLAIVHALALMEKQGIKDKVIYSDSYNAILWVNKKKCKTTLVHNEKTAELHKIIARAEQWLRTHKVTTPIIKWETRQWGEIPADFGRK